MAVFVGCAHTHAFTPLPPNGLLAGFGVTLPTCVPRCDRLERSWTWATAGVRLVVGSPRVGPPLPPPPPWNPDSQDLRAGRHLRSSASVSLSFHR